jgi:hypothetical protein
MTLADVYNVLEGQVYYDKEGRKFSFIDNSIHIDRRAFIPFSIYKEDEAFILQPDTPFTDEKELRIELASAGEESIDFYGKSSGEKLLTLGIRK